MNYNSLPQHGTWRGAYRIQIFLSLCNRSCSDWRTISIYIGNVICRYASMYNSRFRLTFVTHHNLVNGISCYCYLVLANELDGCDRSHRPPHGECYSTRCTAPYLPLRHTTTCKINFFYECVHCIRSYKGTCVGIYNVTRFNSYFNEL